MTQEIVPSTLSNPTATPRAVVDPAHARARSHLARRTHEMSAVVAVPLARARAVARAPSARRGAMMTMTAGTSARRISPSLARVAARGRTTTAQGAADATYDTSAHEQLMSGLKGAALNAKTAKGLCSASCACPGERAHADEPFARGGRRVADAAGGAEPVAPAARQCGSLCCSYWHAFWRAHAATNCSSPGVRPLKRHYCGATTRGRKERGG